MAPQRKLAVAFKPFTRYVHSVDGTFRLAYSTDEPLDGSESNDAVVDGMAARRITDAAIETTGAIARALCSALVLRRLSADQSFGLSDELRRPVQPASRLSRLGFGRGVSQ